MKQSAPAPSIDSVHLLLNQAAHLLDRAAHDIRDSGLAPTRHHIERVAVALSEILEIQQVIYAIRPDLSPAHLNEPPVNSQADSLLTEAMFAASELEAAGDLAGAIEKYRDFLGREAPPLHRSIAEREISRLQGEQDDAGAQGGE